MPHRYKVREIAQQSGLSEATVDRVLNHRPGVRENTRAEVMQAIADLDKQRAQLRLVGRRYLIDVVMQTPQRFSDAFRTAVQWLLETPGLAPQEVLFIGDNPYTDILGAHRVSMRTAWLRMGRDYPSDAPAPDFTIDSLDELRPVLGI